jgi:magnesium chelatase subunit I
MTLGELKASGYRTIPVKEEMRRNLIRKIQAGEEIFPGIIGYDQTVIPQLENAILSRHDFILLGLRGQAKSRILRQLPSLLDERIPTLEGCPIHDDPFRPYCAYCRRLLRERGDQAPIRWLTREERYHEKLATPDVTIADLIGDIDPIKASREQLDLSDEEVIHYGIIPRTNRGIFAINELPDLQPRIQVGLLNIMEERDLQIRGFPLRLPLDILIVYTANPEDYTNRGNIITPLKDRIDSQIMTHYPTTIEQAMRITEQEAWQERDRDLPVPRLFRELIEEITFTARESEYVDQNSGVSARMSISSLENLLSNMEKRALRTGEKTVYPRICDVYAVLPSMTGKMELVYEGEKEGAVSVAIQIIGQAVKRVFNRYFPKVPRQEGERERRGRRREDFSLDYRPASSPYDDISSFFQSGGKVELSDEMPFADYFRELRRVPDLESLARQYLNPRDHYELAGGMEFLLEGLHQHALVAKESLTAAVRYRDVLASVFKEL